MCCVSGCPNASKKSSKNGLKFYRFPTHSIHMPWLCEKRQKWINAVKNHTRRPSNWLPSKQTKICSAHFIDNKKSENPLHASYIPTIFRHRVEKEEKALKVQFKRRQRQMQREECKEIQYNFEYSFEPPKQSIGCQHNDSSSGNQTFVPYFFCNMFNFNGICTAEVQASLVSKIMADKSCEANIPIATKVMKEEIKEEIKDSSCDPLES